MENKTVEKKKVNKTKELEGKILVLEDTISSLRRDIGSKNSEISRLKHSNEALDLTNQHLTNIVTQIENRSFWGRFKDLFKF